jgi:hypothetical protein
MEEHGGLTRGPAQLRHLEFDHESAAGDEVTGGVAETHATCSAWVSRLEIVLKTR